MYCCEYGCVCVCVCKCTTVSMYKSGKNFQEFVVFLQVGARHQTQTLMFGEKDIYPLGRLIGIMPFIMIFFCIYLFSQNK